MRDRTLSFIAAVGALVLSTTLALGAGVSPNITGLQAIGDPNTPTQQLAIGPDGGIAKIDAIGSSNSPTPVTLANPNISVYSLPPGQTSYSSGQSIGGLLTVTTGAGANSPVALQRITYAISAATSLSSSGNPTFLVFNANPTASTCADGSAVVVGAADLPKLTFATVAPVAITVAAPVITGMSSSITDIQTDGNDHLYFCMIATGAWTLSGAAHGEFYLDARK